MILSIVFIANTITLGYLYSKAATSSVIDNVAVQAPQSAKQAPMAPPAPPALPSK
jgi:preprotein translocase subunit SecG